MKIYFVSVVIFILITISLNAQKPVKVTIINGNTSAIFADGAQKQLTFKGIDTEAILSHNANFVVILQTIAVVSNKEDDTSNDETSLLVYDLESSQEKTLIQGCGSNGTGGTPIDYANSAQFPFPSLCDLMNPKLSQDDHRLYFETTAWVTSDAVHFIHLPTGKIYFFHAGSLNDVRKDGNVSINITDTFEKGGRYYQDWLFNPNGKGIKALGKKNE